MYNQSTYKTNHEASKNRFASRFFSVLLILSLICVVGSLGYKLHQTSKEVKFLQDELAIVMYELSQVENDLYSVAFNLSIAESDISLINSDLSSVEYELSSIGALARNANMYAHNHYSDARLKQNIEDIDHPLEKVLILNGVTFEWVRNIASDRGFPKDRQIGFIAQELNEVFPELVSTSVDGYMTVDYAKFSPILVEAIKEQQCIIEEQNEMIKLLQEQTEILDSRLREIEGNGE